MTTRQVHTIAATLLAASLALVPGCSDDDPAAPAAPTCDHCISNTIAAGDWTPEVFFESFPIATTTFVSSAPATGSIANANPGDVVRATFSFAPALVATDNQPDGISFIVLGSTDPSATRDFRGDEVTSRFNATPPISASGVLVFLGGEADAVEILNVVVVVASLAPGTVIRGMTVEFTWPDQWSSHAEPIPADQTLPVEEIRWVARFDGDERGQEPPLKPRE